jgi:hypothetical protein
MAAMVAVSCVAQKNIHADKNKMTVQKEGEQMADDLRHRIKVSVPTSVRD